MGRDTVFDILRVSNDQGILLEVEDGNLSLKSEMDEINDDLLQLIKANKEDIIKYLQRFRLNGLDADRVFAEKIIPYDGEEVKNVPLSYGQERLWFIHQLQGSVGYHLPRVLPLGREVDLGLLERVLRTIVERHEVLRTVIGEQDGVGYQRLRPAKDWSMEQECIDSEAARQTRLAAFVARPFDLSADYMIRACLFETAGADAMLAVVVHHIASDGWSGEILEKEFRTIYGALRRGEPLELQPQALQYRDYAVWQRRYLSGEYLERQLAWWERRLAGAPALQLPTDGARQVVKSLAGEVMTFVLDRELGDGLRKLCREEEVTMYMVMLSAFVVLLQRYSGQDDICVGTPVANRTQRELEGMIGFFVNTLVIRSDAGGDPAFEELLGRVRQATLEAYDHQQAPFEKVVERVVKDRDWSRNPLFQVMFTLENIARETKEQEALPIAMMFDLSLTVEAGAEGGIGYRIGYSTELFGRERIGRMGRHYEQLLKSVAGDRTQSLSRLSLLTREEEIKLASFNKTEVAYPDKTVIGLFEEQVDKTPHAVAVVGEGAELTYGDLEARSNRLAAYLRGLGVGPEMLVPLCVERSVEMIIGMLGIWKAGGVYVPVDGGYPEERIRYMLEDTGATLIVSSAWLHDHAEAIGREPAERKASHSRARDLAYVIYTSGSTGRPKGVGVEHGNLGHFMRYIQDRYGKEGKMDMALVASTSFDIHLFQLGCALLSGGCCRLCGQEEVRDMARLVTVLKEVNSIDTVPAVYRALVQQLEADGEVMKSIGKVFIGGDTIGDELLVQLRGVFPAAQIVVTYGPTEGTIFCTDKEYAVSAGTAMGRGAGIGWPIANARIHVLDAHGQPAPVGVPGEIGIAGAGVARGYLNQVELTAATFVEYNGGRLYRTGDRGRWLPDGSIEFLGRKDEQVKVRGYRIEPGEIESVLAGQPGVKGGCVIAREERLVGYVVIEAQLDKGRLEAELSKALPEYMVPRVWVELEALPLTANGKIDRKALPDPLVSAGPDKEYTAPRSAIEAELASIWSELLGTKQVGIHDDFFSLGGHSLLATRLVAMVRSRMKVAISIRDVFQYAILGDQADYISRQRKTVAGNEHLITLQAQGAEPPIFILPGVMGFCDDYFDLANAFGEDQPVYGINMTGYYPGESPLSSIETIARQNIEWIKNVRPQGPYRIIGHSMGGQVAYEMLRQLQTKEDLQDSTLVLLDVMASKPAFSGDAGAYAKGLLRSVSDINIVELVKANLEIAYSPKGNIKVKTILVLGTNQDIDSDGFDISLGWWRFIEDIGVVYSSGDHDSMVKGAHAIDLAKQLKDNRSL